MRVQERKRGRVRETEREREREKERERERLVVPENNHSVLSKVQWKLLIVNIFDRSP